MKARTLSPLGTMFAAALFLGSFPLTVRGQATAPATPATPAAKEAKQAVAKDYLVRCERGKGVMWASQAETMHPKPKYTAISKANHNDFLVQVGKRAVPASSIRRDDTAATRPATHDKSCVDYQIQVGKRVEWASAANCPMGKHEKGVKPLCCVAPTVAEQSKMPRCCKDAQAK